MTYMVNFAKRRAENHSMSFHGRWRSSQRWQVLMVAQRSQDGTSMVRRFLRLSWSLRFTFPQLRDHLRVVEMYWKIACVIHVCVLWQWQGKAVFTFLKLKPAQFSSFVVPRMESPGLLLVVLSALDFLSTNSSVFSTQTSTLTRYTVGSGSTYTQTLDCCLADLDSFDAFFFGFDRYYCGWTYSSNNRDWRDAKVNQTIWIYSSFILYVVFVSVSPFFFGKDDLIVHYLLDGLKHLETTNFLDPKSAWSSNIAHGMTDVSPICFSFPVGYLSYKHPYTHKAARWPCWIAIYSSCLQTRPIQKDTQLVTWNFHSWGTDPGKWGGSTAFLTCFFFSVKSLRDADSQHRNSSLILRRWWNNSRKMSMHLGCFGKRTHSCFLFFPTTSWLFRRMFWDDRWICNTPMSEHGT